MVPKRSNIEKSYTQHNIYDINIMENNRSDHDNKNHMRIINNVTVKPYGVNTIGKTYGRNYDIRSDMPVPKIIISPWLCPKKLNNI